jgi:hypothetical protein
MARVPSSDPISRKMRSGLFLSYNLHIKELIFFGKERGATSLRPGTDLSLDYSSR